MKHYQLLKKSGCYEWGLLFVVGILAVFSIDAISQEKYPKLVIESEIYDFGLVTEGEVVSHEFIIRNNGNDVLNIEKVSPT